MGTLICLAASVIPWAFVAIQLRWLRPARASITPFISRFAVIYAQWILAPPLFWGHAGLLALVTAAFGVYYTLADLAAVRAGTWFFDEKLNHGRQVGRHFAVGRDPFFS